MQKVSHTGFDVGSTPLNIAQQKSDIAQQGPNEVLSRDAHGFHFLATWRHDAAHQLDQTLWLEGFG